jgi:hypothetical protein
MKSRQTTFGFQKRRVENRRDANMLRVLPGKLRAEAVKKNLAILDHLAGDQRAEDKMGKWKVEPVQKSVAVLGSVAALEESSRNLEVFKTAARPPGGGLGASEIRGVFR